jgi:hypothetical protein
VGEGREMTQTLYAHMNKKKFFKFLKSCLQQLLQKVKKKKKPKKAKAKIETCTW